MSPRIRSISALLSLCLCVSVVNPLAAQPAFDKAALAWTLPWDADWVTAAAFVGPNRLAAGNNLGDILIWDLPEKTGGLAPLPARRLAGHDNTINRLLTTPDAYGLISISNDRTVRYWDLQTSGTEPGIVVLNARAIENAQAKKKKSPAPLEAKVQIQKPSRT